MFFLFFFNQIYSSTFVFTLIFQKIYQSWYYLCYIRVYGGCNIQLNQLIQPLVIIHFIHIRCYETDVADIVMHTALISLAVYEKGRENKKKLHRYRLQNMRQTVVPSGSHGYLPTRHSSAHRSPVYPSD